MSEERDYPVEVDLAGQILEIKRMVESSSDDEITVEVWEEYQLDAS